MIARLFAGALLLFSAACAATPLITSRPISGDTTGAAWFVRLDTMANSRATDESRFEHPATLSEPDLTEMLSRVQTQARVGAMDTTPPPQPLFSSHDLTRLVPGIQKALRAAGPSEWATFYSAGPTVISGSLFLQGGALHVVIANHHDPAPAEPGSLDVIRANPLSPWKGQRLTLSFDPARFVAETKTTWMGGTTGAPAGELVLRHQAFLAFLADKPDKTIGAVPLVPVHDRPAPPPVMPQPIPSPQLPSPQPIPSSQAIPAMPPPETDNRALNEHLRSLQGDIAQLRRRLEEQDDDIARIKTRLFELDVLRKNQQENKPAR